jgi:uncharacterized protein YbjT (DUF2867 family)
LEILEILFEEKQGVPILQKAAQQAMIALVAGASGLTGSVLVKLLEQDVRYERIYVLTRRLYQPASEKTTPILFEENIAAMGSLPGPLPDVVFCCLGTTIKKAGSQEAFRFVDVELVSRLIGCSVQWGTRCFVLQSSVGAGQETRNFYLQCKTEAEACLSQSSIPSKIIIRPSLLLGKRKELRLGETVGKILAGVFGFLFVGWLKRYKPVYAKNVALKMLNMATNSKDGLHVIESEHI